jgi:hypothetical protein
MEENNINSPYLLQKIKETSWKNRDYINDLIRLERMIQKGPQGFAGGQIYFLLREKYPVEFLELLKEASPKRYKAALADQQKSEIEKASYKEKMIAAEKQEAEKEKKAYANWIALGGKP